MYTATMRTLITRAILPSLCAVLGIAQTMTNTSCNTAIGRRPTTFNNPPQTSPSMLSGLFLNTNYGCNCDGQVIAWEFCYYQRSKKLNTTIIQAGIWRKNNSEYHLVNNSIISLPILDYEEGIEFVCRHLNVENQSLINVEQGDTIGMYIDDTSDDDITIHMFETANPEHPGGIMKVENITNIDSKISDSMFVKVSYSLYLEALIRTDDTMTYTECKEATTFTTDSESTTTRGVTTEGGSTKTFPVWAKVVIAVLGLLLLLFLILIVAMAFKICRLTKGSGPVLITKLKKKNHQVIRVPTVENTDIRNRNETDSEINGISEDRLPQPTPRLHQPLLPPPVLVVTEKQSLPDQYKTTSTTNSSISQPPKVFTIAFDDEQQLDIDQEWALVKPKHRQPPCTLSHKPALLPKMDLRRSRSAAEAMNLMHSDATDDEEACLTSSTEYPYVLHSFEVVGKDRVFIGSLPNINELTHHTSQTNFIVTDNVNKNPIDDNEQYNPDSASCAHLEDEDSNTIYDELSHYPNAVREHVHSTRDDLTEDASHDYHYEEYPSNWTPSANLTLELRKPATGPNDIQSPEYQEIEVRGKIIRSDSAALPSNQVSSLKQAVVKKNTAPILNLKQKPPVQPRKKLARLLMVSNQPSELVIENQSDIHTTNDSATLSAETPNKYMKLLQSTTDELHNYTYLLHGSTELHKLTNTDAEKDNPN